MGDAAQVLDAARARGWRIATAESCTGGLIAGALTEVPGSSDVVECGYVTYSNAAKTRMLGVTAAALDAHGAVSEEVAREMAHGAWGRAGVDLAVSVTGIAGPGGSEFKPEGMVCFGLATPTGVITETMQFGALGRAQVRQTTVERALTLLLQACDS
ncbi:nicotinamide-nucleotide amidase [Litoreibacter ponti]|uniref:Nicotinamide-nucleotide amidase n=1 Tax=Litoreibacter ponti TaxID=1510457 RepID=A0A2T6BIS6_9RHOB|nr:CinA family protein [Litoreibacter ponti]PTX55957.1 nicotinamide-nucleotide amidase [Litoreibacter ponti]